MLVARRTIFRRVVQDTAALSGFDKLASLGGQRPVSITVVLGLIKMCDGLRPRGCRLSRDEIDRDRRRQRLTFDDHLVC